MYLLILFLISHLRSLLTQFAGISWTGDLFKSTVHRVVVPSSPEKQEMERFSIALFCHPDDGKVIETLPSCLRRGGKLYTPITALRYLLDRLHQTY